MASFGAPWRQNVGRLLNAANLGRRQVSESGTWGFYRTWLVKDSKVLIYIFAGDYDLYYSGGFFLKSWV